MANNEVRIIGGQWKGRKLSFPAHAGLRPTLGRVRETLFNWLAPSLSRGAAEVTFVERDRKAVAAIRANVERLHARASVHQQPAERFLSRTSGAFHIIFADPPFDHPFGEAQLHTLLGRLEPQGLLYLERGRRQPMPCGALQIKRGSAGDCQFALYPAPGDLEV
jgi:16S rRNA (guanine966-N2)-methyltransferase